MVRPPYLWGGHAVGEGGGEEGEEEGQQGQQEHPVWKESSIYLLEEEKLNFH